MFSLIFLDVSKNIIEIKGCARQNDSCDSLINVSLNVLPKNFTISKNMEHKCIQCNTELCNENVLKIPKPISNASNKTNITAASKKSEPSKSSSHQIFVLFWVLVLATYIFL